MRPALLVASREYAENAKTKGFWIGLFLFPVLITASIFVQLLLNEATPTRYFVLDDRSGVFGAAVDARLEALHNEVLAEALASFLRENAADPGSIDKTTLESLETLVLDGGLETGLAHVLPLLREDAPAFVEPRRRFERVALPPELSRLEIDALIQELKPYLRGDRKLPTGEEDVELFAAMLVPSDIERRVVRPGSVASDATGDRAGVQYWSVNLADDDLRDTLERLFNKEIRRLEYLNRGMDVDTVRLVEDTRIPLSSLNPKKEEGDEEVGVADIIRQWAPVGFVYLLWIAIFSVSQMLLNNTIEEKSNRIIEVLLSSVTAGELMLGKLLGIACIGLTMVGTWIASLFLVLGLQSGPSTEVPSVLLEVLKTSGLLPAFAMYFVLGYLLYSGIFLTIGSLCNTLKEAQNLMGPVMMIMMIPLFTMMFIPKDPNGTLATIMSWIPLYTPFVMMNRAAADPPLFDVVGTLILLLATTALVLWLSGRIFRIGILRTGQPPKLVELLRWVRS